MVARRLRKRRPGARLQRPRDPADPCALPRRAGAGTRYNGVDVERFRPVDARPPRTILFTGRIAPDKGVHVLCDAFRLVRQRVPDATLELVGQEAPVAREMQVALSDDPRVRALERFYGSGYRAELGAAR